MVSGGGDQDLPSSSPCNLSTRSPNSIISSAFRTSDAEMLLCCFDWATS
jgi:hypothetical protein